MLKDRLILTLRHFDELLEILEVPTPDESINGLLQELVTTVKMMKSGQLALVTELLIMYDSASEHNVDIDRRVIYQLAQRIAAVEPPPPNPTDSGE